jgi:DNA-binding transcriptional ArsR family regulator
MEKAKLDKKFETIKTFFEKVFENPEKFPDKALILPLDEQEISEIFTKKRIEIIKEVAKSEISLSEIAKRTSRELSAVQRDVEILERAGILETEKQGRVVRASLKGEILILPLVEIKQLRLNDLEVSA